MPDHHRLREHRHLQLFGTLLHDPNLWHLNRRSAAGAVAIGLFVAWIPVPGQMILAAGLAILFRVNLPLAVVLVWVTNPVTFAPMFYTAYRLGGWILGMPMAGAPHPEFSPEALVQVWEPLMTGCLVLGTISALLGYLVVRLLWRWRIVRALRARRLRRPPPAP